VIGNLHIDKAPVHVTSDFTLKLHSNMSFLLKFLVALPRKQYHDGITLIDLAYITPNIIVTSMPTNDGVRSLYRTTVDELRLFLHMNHGENWHIWNIRSEKEGDYDDQDFDFKVSHFGFIDHNAPPFELIPRITYSIHQFISADPKNVAVIHCKAGQGRSGTIACAYLMCFENMGIDKAIARFTTRRMRSFFGSGVTIPSQLRYLQYTSKWKQFKGFYAARLQVELSELKIWELRYKDLEITCSSYVITPRRIRKSTSSTQSLATAETVLSSLPSHSTTTANVVEIDDYIIRELYKFSEDDFVPSTDPSVTIIRPHIGPIILPLDILFAFKRDKVVKQTIALTHSTSHIWFNAFFETFNPANPRAKGTLTVDWDQFDGFIGTKKRGSKGFEKVQFSWKLITQVSQTDGTQNLADVQNFQHTSFIRA
jgi:protein-tyrosine phosphatase